MYVMVKLNNDVLTTSSLWQKLTIIKGIQFYLNALQITKDDSEGRMERKKTVKSWEPAWDQDLKPAPLPLLNLNLVKLLTCAEGKLCDYIFILYALSTSTTACGYNITFKVYDYHLPNATFEHYISTAYTSEQSIVKLLQ